MLEALQVIAVVCTVSVGAMGISIKKVEKTQRICQQTIQKCVEKKLKKGSIELLGKYLWDCNRIRK